MQFDENSHCLTFSYAFMISNGTISWMTKKQGTMAISTTESEYMALNLSAQEALFL